MRCRTLLTSVLLASGCGGGDSISPPRPIDASESGDAREPRDADPAPSDDAAQADGPPAPDAGSSSDAGVTCARAPLGEWTGAAVIKDEGGGSYSAVRADIRWVLDSSEACIDRYRPTGTVTFTFLEPCDNTIEPASIPVPSTDGVLTIDRRRLPVTYEIRGATTWDASITCEGDPPEAPAPVGGPWVLGRGSFDGNVIAGGFYQSDRDSAWWELTRVETPFPDDGPDCAEPPLDHLWGTGFVDGGSNATVTWTRTSTSGCTDTFAPSGVAASPTESSTCSTIVTEPPSAPIASSDGVLTVDRYRRPISIQFRGDTSWKGWRLCRRPDGEMFIEHGSMGGAWGWSFQAAFDGIAYAGSTTHNGSDYAWSITRLPPPVAASSPAP